MENQDDQITEAMDAEPAEYPLNESEVDPDSSCSPQWFTVNGGTHEVATWVDESSQERAEMAFRGWVRLGCPDCETVREVNDQEREQR
jgi:hypothetical protein